MKNGRAAAEDGVLTKMLKLGSETLIKQLEILFNKCLESEDIPDDWTN